MVTETMAKSQRELSSLWGLVILNIIFGGLAMAFGVSITVQSIFPMIDASSILFPQIIYVVLGFSAAAVSIRWLVSSVEVLDGADELNVEYSKRKQGLNEEGLASLIIKMMSYYRENKSTIKTMVLISRIAGGCFLVSGTFSLGNALASVMAGAPQWTVIIQVLGTALGYAMAATCFAIPHFFGKYSRIWDYRLEQTAKAEIVFKRQIGEDLE